MYEALSIEPPHVSAYNLTVEEGTPFHREYRAGRIRLLPEEKEIAMAELVEQTLAKHGLERYEISNYARTGFRSQHNVNYWRGGDYLGIGAGAHSYEQREGCRCGYRRHNEKHPARYMENIENTGAAVAEEEKTDFRTAVAEFMFLGLRMTEGIRVQTFFDRFGKKPDEVYPRIADWIAGEFMEYQNGNLRLTPRGLMVANSIFVNFV